MLECVVVAWLTCECRFPIKRQLGCVTVGARRGVMQFLDEMLALGFGKGEIRAKRIQQLANTDTRSPMLATHEKDGGSQAPARVAQNKALDALLKAEIKFIPETVKDIDAQP